MLLISVPALIVVLISPSLGQGLPPGCTQQTSLELNGTSGELSSPGFENGDDLQDGLICKYYIRPDPKVMIVFYDL